MVEPFQYRTFGRLCSADAYKRNDPGGCQDKGEESIAGADWADYVANKYNGLKLRGPVEKSLTKEREGS